MSRASSVLCRVQTVPDHMLTNRVHTHMQQEMVCWCSFGTPVSSKSASHERECVHSIHM